MILNEKIIASRILAELKTKNKIQYKNITQKDIERLIRFYVRTIVRFSRLGYAITLSCYKNRKKERAILIVPYERNIVQYQFKAVTAKDRHKRKSQGN